MRKSFVGALVVALLAGVFSVATAPRAEAAATLPDFPMLLPVGWGLTVQGGGTHTFASGVRSSVDLGAAGNASVDVVAAADGVLTTVKANCEVIITHQGGWQTKYFHLRAIPAGLAAGQQVAAGTKLGMTGMPGSETCGRGTFRHVHFTLMKAGTEVPIDGLQLGGYAIHGSGGAYCGYWTRNSDGAVVADARRSCYAVPALSNTLLPASALHRASQVAASRDVQRPVIAAADTIDAVALYVTEGQHTVGGRAWRTTCEPYSQTERCRTEIWASIVENVAGYELHTEGWVFNNLTYKPAKRELWVGNDLGTPGSWSDAQGRQWRTECDTAATGRGACRTYVRSSAGGAEVFNNLVRFSD
ncbi:M23 family metallopeptidase [Tessaracoccus sp. MC1756]|uniref:M23 family metallopeptidase n=1 Tax=Tessaracoccus sp. MC1756 TaxID=2760311 RepID=UPI001601C29C|nr:M23 family metallopeptidase [Tessaracoccus sp. MC1756]